jgi:hypothetical protein
MPKFEAKVNLPGGRKETVSVNAADREDAKYHFAHNVIEIDGQPVNEAKVDMRTVRLAAEQPADVVSEERENANGE